MTQLEVGAAILLAAALLWMVLSPLFGGVHAVRGDLEPLDAEETPRGAALGALRELEFDRETGKISDSDYGTLKSQYTAEALAALRADAALDADALIAARRQFSGGRAPECSTCGPRPELDAVFCSSCGSRIGAPSACERCGAALPPDSRFCADCGARVAA